MYNNTVSEGKTIAIISYFHVIGLLIAFVMNQNKRNPFASFHIRQSVGLVLLSFLVNFLNRFSNFDWLSNLLWFGVFALWVIALIGAFQGQEKRIPLLGDQFQEWFKSIG